MGQSRTARFAKCCREDQVFSEEDSSVWRGSFTRHACPPLFKETVTDGYFKQEKLQWHSVLENATVVSSSRILDEDDIVAVSRLLSSEDCHHHGMK